MIIVDESLPVGELPPPFPPRDVEVKLEENIREAYDMKKEIGRGRFGTVYLCTCKKTNLNFAAKFVNTKRKQDRRNVEREIEIMKTLSDKGARQKLIQLYDAYDMGKEMCLVLEIVEGGELFERVTDDDFELTERACAIFIRQICEAIEYVHSKNILHLDMKPENILCLSREGNRVKICDFGLARKYDPRKKLQVLFGTPEFVAPEVVNFEPINFGTDMWSIGVITYVLLSGLSPFMGHNYVETMTNVTHNKYDFDDEAFDEVSDDAKDFIERLLLLDKSSRMTPEKCFHHPWISKLFKNEPPNPIELKERDKINLKIYNTRRKWCKAMHTITAIKRMRTADSPEFATRKSLLLSDISKLPSGNQKIANGSLLTANISRKFDMYSNSNPMNYEVQLNNNFQRCHSTTEQNMVSSSNSFAKSQVTSQSSNQIDILQNQELYEQNFPLNPDLSEDVSSNFINFSKNSNNKNDVCEGQKSKNSGFSNNKDWKTKYQNPGTTSMTKALCQESNLKSNLKKQEQSAKFYQIKSNTNWNNNKEMSKTAYELHSKRENKNSIPLKNKFIKLANIPESSSNNLVTNSQLQCPIKTSKTQIDLVDQLLSEFKTERKYCITLRPTNTKTDILKFPRKSFQKPYIDITTDGLPKNTGSVREMAKILSKQQAR